MEIKDELQAKISQIDEQIEELEKELESLADERYEYEQELMKVERTEKTVALLNSIFEITDENTQSQRLFHNTATTPIIDKFANSDKRFLVFTRAFCLSPVWKHVSLVIAKSSLGINYDNNGLVLTDLKKAVGDTVSEYSYYFLHDSSRLFPLYRELITVAKKTPAKGEIVPFERVCLIGGQTYDDQTGFGSEYCGSDLVYEGKEYGETTKFVIIGVIVED